jgi:hypothetical protein
MANKLLAAWIYGTAAIFALGFVLLYIIIPLGIHFGKETEVRNAAVVLFITGGIIFFGYIGCRTWKLAPMSPSSQSKSSVEQPDRVVTWAFTFLIFFGLIRIVLSVFLLLFIYGIIVLVFRYAFGVELPNPFG